jgi:hypothetical protein
MKRLALLLALLSIPVAVQAFDEQKPAGAVRIGVLRNVSSLDQRRVATTGTLPSSVRDRLRRDGFDAFTLDATLDELEQRQDRDADYYVELSSSSRYDDPYAQVGIGNRNFQVGVGVVSTEVAAEVDVYDGRTLELVARYDLRAGRTAVGPTSVAAGGGSIFALVQIPIGYWQYASAVRQVAKQAAVKIAETVREP